MPLIYVILIFMVVGLVLWLINKYVPMQEPIKQVMNVVVVILLIFWVITLLFPALLNIRVGH